MSVCLSVNQSINQYFFCLSHLKISPSLRLRFALHTRLRPHPPERERHRSREKSPRPSSPSSSTQSSKPTGMRAWSMAPPHSTYFRTRVLARHPPVRHATAPSHPAQPSPPTPVPLSCTLVGSVNSRRAGQSIARHGRGQKTGPSMGGVPARLHLLTLMK